MFSSDGGLDAQLSYRCRLAGDAFRRLNKPAFRHSQVSLPTKMRIYRAMVASVLLYGAHAWALSTKQLERLELVQRKQLRQVLATAAGGRVPGAATARSAMKSCWRPVSSPPLSSGCNGCKAAGWGMC